MGARAWLNVETRAEQPPLFCPAVSAVSELQRSGNSHTTATHLWLHLLQHGPQRRGVLRHRHPLPGDDRRKLGGHHPNL